MRGQGRVFQRGNKFWISYYQRGKEFRESAGDTEAEAKRYLKKRLKEISGDRFVTPQAEKLTVDELLDSLIIHLTNKEAKGIKTYKSHLKSIREAFGFDRVIDITSERVERYISDKKKEGKANATINRQTGLLKQAMNLALKQEKLNRIPYIPKLKEDNTRTGFFESDQFQAVCDHLPDYLKDVALFGYLSGWRKGEILPLKWDAVDHNAREIRLRTSKNSKGRILPLAGEFWELIEKRWSAREVKLSSGETYVSPFIFNNKGNQIIDFRKAWITATTNAGCPGKLFHDFRRTAARNMTRAGVQQVTAMSITGHETISMFQRYNIVSTDDQTKALLATQSHIASNPTPNRKKVVSLT
jgi:integrase